MSGFIGRSVRRKEDPALLRGEAKFISDIRLPGTLHAVIVRSPYAHARIVAVDTSAARSLAGVIDVLTAQDVSGIGPIPVRVHPMPELSGFLQYSLAKEKGRYVGDPVAVVVATTPHLAEDAAQMVDIDYEPLPTVTDWRAALAEGAPLLFDGQQSNLAASWDVEVGDIEAAFREAHHTVSGEFKIQRHTGSPLETRGLVAAFDATSGRLTVWGPTKVVHANRGAVAALLGLAEDDVRFVEPAVGGGFGIRGEIYPEDILIPFAAMRLGKPVKWIEDRREHLVSANHSRDQWYRAELALADDGRILGLKCHLVQEQGGYVRTHGVRVAEISADVATGPYRIANYRCHVQCVLTNKTPTGTYRAPGRFEVNFARERLIDMAARELEMDPADLRRINLLTADDIPYKPGTIDFGEPIVFDSGDPAAMFEHVLQKAGYAALRTEQRTRGEREKLLGIGVCAFMEDGGLGGLGGTPGEFARVAVSLAGGVTVYSGVGVLGQGLVTSLAQICAGELGIGPEDVSVVHGDTDQVPWGGGTWASRGAILAGNACFHASAELAKKLRALAARLLEALPEDIELAGGRALVRGTGAGAPSVSFAELARAAFDGESEGVDPGTILEANSLFRSPRMTYSPGAHVAVVEVDAGTGVVELVQNVVVYDVGRTINPRIVEGQIHGGMVQGIGGALYEELAYDEEGQPLSTTFDNYLMPTAFEVPVNQEVDAVEATRSPLNTLGVKGVGEVGPASAGAALGNAVADALSHLGVRANELPLKPDRVWRWIREAGGFPSHPTTKNRAPAGSPADQP